MVIPTQDVNDNERVILDLVFRKNVISRKDVEEVLAISQSMAGRIIKQLVDKAVLVSVGSGRNKKYMRANGE